MGSVAFGQFHLDKSSSGQIPFGQMFIWTNPNWAGAVGQNNYFCFVVGVFTWNNVRSIMTLRSRTYKHIAVDHLMLTLSST